MWKMIYLKNNRLDIDSYFCVARVVDIFIREFE